MTSLAKEISKRKTRDFASNKLTMATRARGPSSGGVKVTIGILEIPSHLVYDDSIATCVLNKPANLFRVSAQIYLNVYDLWEHNECVQASGFLKYSS